MAPAGLWIATLAAALAVAASLLLRDPRRRAAAIVLALVLAAATVAADNWDTGRFEELRDDPLLVAAAVVAGALATAVVAAILVRRPAAFPLLAIAAMPFRVPVDVGGNSANLLLPLYLVIAAAVAAAVYAALSGRPPAWAQLGRGPGDERSAPALSRLRWLRVALALTIVLYAIQSAYSDDFSAALENMAFFFVPFAVLFSLLLDVRWSPRLLAIGLAIVVAEAVAFTLVGAWQLVTRDLFWNQKVIAGNEVHSWFRVNSLFWDPNILGRYLAVALVALAAVVAFARSARVALGAMAIAILLLAGIGFSFSQSSLLALIAGLAVVAALRWGPQWPIGVAAAAAAVLIAVVLGSGSVGDVDVRSLDVETTGRVSLARGGLELAGDAPLAGHGSGGFAEMFRDRYGGGRGVAVVSHTEPLTIAAEQGALGLIAYTALVVAAVWVLLTGMRRLAPGLGGPGPDQVSSRGVASQAARAALLATFAAMLVHSLAYAAFLTDPITWALLAIGGSLALTPVAAIVRRSEVEGRRRRGEAITATG